MYIGWDGREYEDAEMDNMRRDHAEELRQEYNQQFQAGVWEYESQIDGIIREATRRNEYWSLGGCDGPSPLVMLQEALALAQARMNELRYHTHQWNEDDYCDICGNDGRA